MSSSSSQKSNMVEDKCFCSLLNQDWIVVVDEEESLIYVSNILLDVIYKKIFSLTIGIFFGSTAFVWKPFTSPNLIGH